ATGSITGTGALTFTAGGTNQNVTLAPSGTGYTLLNGKVGIGTTNPAAQLDVVGSVAFEDNSNTTNGAYFSFWKSRNYAAVQLNDVLGYFNYYGSDGSFQRRAAYISSAVDGTVASGSVPGNLTFFTTSAGNSDGTERMRITSAGNVGIGTVAPAYKLDIGNSAATSQLAFNGALVMHQATSNTNIFVGTSTGNTSMTGTYNTAMGNASLASNTTGTDNVAIGSGTMYLNTTGSSNSGFGGGAIRSNTSGSNNVGFGNSALYSVATGSNNTAIGINAGFYANSNSGGNVFIGYNAGPSSATTLSNKLYIANAAGTPLIYGDFVAGNVGLGTTTPAGKLSIQDAGVPGIQIKTTGAGAIDTFNLINDSNANGHFWIAKGTTANATPAAADGLVNITNEGNVEIYGQAVTTANDKSGVLALKTQSSATGGTRNEVSLEFYADRTNLNAMSGNIGFESNTTLDMTVNNKQSANMIFSTADTERMRITSTGNVGVGKTPTYKLDINGDTNISSGFVFRIAGTQICTSAGCTSSSDERLKENIQPLENSLEKILQLQGVEYDYKDKAKFGDKHQIGVIAQEVEKVYPEVVITDAKTTLKSVAYDHLVAPLIESVKALYNRITGVERKIASIEAENASLKAKNKELEQRLEKIEKALNSK
ncbi:MAG: tail fiber domain-containing protein, partial [Bdellovibrio sp.]